MLLLFLNRQFSLKSQIKLVHMVLKLARIDKKSCLPLGSIQSLESGRMWFTGRVCCPILLYAQECFRSLMMMTLQ